MLPEHNFPLHSSSAWCGERRVGHLLALEPCSSSPVPSHRLGAAQTCPTTAQVTVPAVIPTSDSQSPSPLQPPLCPQLTPFYHPGAIHIQRYSPLPSSPYPYFSSAPGPCSQPTNNAPGLLCYRCSSPAQLNPPQPLHFPTQCFTPVSIAPIPNLPPPDHVIPRPPLPAPAPLPDGTHGPRAAPRHGPARAELRSRLGPFRNSATRWRKGTGGGKAAAQQH